MSKIFLGADHQTADPVTCELVTSALTIAQPRTGKGAAQIIPTLRHHWTENVISIDPKGEALSETAKYREDMGQQVIALDPVPDLDTGEYCSEERFRHTINPLDLVREGGGFIDINMIADGLIRQDGSSHPFFDSTGRTLITGLIAFILEFAPEHSRNLSELPRLIRDLANNDASEGELSPRAALLSQMDDCSMYGELAADAAALIRTDNNTSDSILKTAADHLKWLSDENMQRFFSTTSFDFNDLRKKPVSVYLVLTPDALEQHGQFLRLFTRCALAVMKRGQVSGGHSDSIPCLFILDEFAKLGRIDVIKEDAGLMPGYGVHLWCLLQGIGQLDIYGRDGADLFVGPATAISFFGLGNDNRSARFASEMVGAVTDSDISHEWDYYASKLEHSEKVRLAQNLDNPISALFSNEYAREKYDRMGGMFRFAGNADVLVRDFPVQAQLDQLRSRVGKPRIPPDQVRKITARDDQTKVAKAAFVFMGGDYKILALSPYFAAYQAPPPLEPLEDWAAHMTDQPSPVTSNPSAPVKKQWFGAEEYWVFGGFLVVGLFITAMAFLTA